jgi:excinuclease UvrABC nuclease subunit
MMETQRGGGETDLRQDLREFATARPSGWSHEDWLEFLAYLRERGHDTSNADTIGLDLERERLAAVLAGVPGLGPRRMQAVLDRFGSVWNLGRARIDEIASVPTIHRGLAEQIAQRVR